MSQRATCPKCGREDTPIKKNGKEFKAHFPRGGGEWCYGPRQEEKKMAYGDMNEPKKVATTTAATYFVSEAHERRAQQLMDQATRELELAEKARMLLERFGRIDDYPDEAAIMWHRSFDTDGPEYTYVAIKVNSCWYLTGQQRSGISHERLIVEHLQYATDDVWIVKEWASLA